LRHRFGDLLRSHIAQTMPEGAALDDELQHLIAALSQ
jgi:hypothetical protein